MTLTDTKSSVKIVKDLKKPFYSRRGLKHGDGLSCDLFNIVMKMIMRNAAVNTSGTIFKKSHMLLAYADDVNIIGQKLRDMTAAFSSIQKESAEM